MYHLRGGDFDVNEALAKSAAIAAKNNKKYAEEHKNEPEVRRIKGQLMTRDQYLNGVEKRFEENYKRDHPIEDKINKIVEPVLKGLTTFADVGINVLPVNGVVKQAYKQFAPPGSMYHKGSGNSIKNKSKPLLYMKHNHCNHCHGAGFMDILKSGLNFISGLFGKKSEQSKQQEDYHEPPPQDYYEEPPQYHPDSEFAVRGARKDYLLSVLGLPKTATKAEAIKAYRKLVLKYHPDKGGDPEDFRRVNSAKVELTGSGFNLCPHCQGCGASGGNKAHKIGQKMSEQIYRVHGAGFWNDFADGFKKGFNTVTKPVFDVASKIPGKIGTAASLANTARSAVLGNETFGRGYSGGKLGEYGHGQKRLPFMFEEIKVMPIKKATKKRLGEDGHGMQLNSVKGSGVDKRKSRAEVVKKIMANNGLSMIEASKYVKEHNIPY